MHHLLVITSLCLLALAVRKPAAAQPSALQARLDAAPAGAVVVVEAGRYEGDLVINRPIRLVGHGRPLLVGSGSGTVVSVRAADVTIDGFDIDGRGGGDLGSDSSGIHVAAPRATVTNCRVRNSLFGIYLREAPGARLERNRVEGIVGKSPGEKGSGIHVWNTDGFVLIDNTVVQARDGFYIQSSPHGLVRGNVARDLRYGLHYMFSDDNVFEGNRFENGAAGTAIMYSRRIVFRRNAFLRNRGFASVGLLLKSCDDVLAEDNLIADNARGVFLEGSARTTLRRNILAASDVAIVLYDSSTRTRVEGNSFVANLSPLTLVGRRADASFTGNYWADHDAPDLDGDGRRDVPYRLSSLFDHFRGNLTAADLYSQSLAASALAVAERAFPILDPVPLVDAAPLAAPPDLPLVPRADGAPPGRNLSALAAAVGMALAGIVAWRSAA